MSPPRSQFFIVASLLDPFRQQPESIVRFSQGKGPVDGRWEIPPPNVGLHIAILLATSDEIPAEPGGPSCPNQLESLEVRRYVSTGPEYLIIRAVGGPLDLTKCIKSI